MTRPETAGAVVGGGAAGVLRVGWLHREPPLAPAAVAGRGPVAAALARACLDAKGELDPARNVLLGVAGDGLLVLVGPPDALPWADGAAWLGRDRHAPGLLLPTTRAPDVPPALYARAVLARAPEGAAPIAVLLDPPIFVPVGHARPLHAETIRAWLDGPVRA